MMSNISYVAMSLLLLLSSCGQNTEPVSSDGIFDILINNQSQDTLSQYGVDLDLVRVDADFHLKKGDQNIPVQIEDRNKNNKPDKMYALVDLLPGSTERLTAYPGKLDIKTPQVRVHANLSNGDKVEGKHLVNFEEKWAAGGIVIENEWIGYRAIMTPPYAFDVIGKTKPDLLESPININLEQVGDWGGDALDEGLSLGIGSPAIFDLEKIVPLTQFDSKEIEIVERGPLRAEVRMRINGVPVRNEKIDVLITWMMQPGKHWSQVSFSILSKTDLNLQFAIGLPKHEEATDFTQGLLDEVHFAYTYGLQSVQGEQLGMAIMVPGKYEVDTYRDDPHNYFYLVNPINQATEYRILAAWVKGRLTIFDEISFLDLVKKYTAEYGAQVSIQPNFRISN